MQKAGQKSQQKSGNLKVYAFEVSRINAATLALKLRMLGGVSSVRTIAVSELPTCISQIEQALVDGADEVEINVGSGVCAISPVLLKNLKTSLSSYHAVSGGSGAQVVRKGVSTPVKSKAPARAVSSAARKNLISQKDTRANSDVELDNTAHTAQVSADFENQVAQIVGKELRKAVMPLLAEIDAIAALLKECALEATASKPVRKRNAGKSSTDWETPISIKRGRTSVVVGSRKVS